MGGLGALHRDRIVIDRGYFLNRVTVDGRGCWIWMLAKSHNGYGEATKNHKRVRAHRLSYEILVGEIPGGFQVDHLCGVRLCVNPEHLEAVTPRVNNERSNSPSALNAKKTHCLRGHEFTRDNIYRRKDRPNDRACRKCILIRHLTRKRG